MSAAIRRNRVGISPKHKPTVFSKFTFRPWASVICPSSRICSSTFSTSGWAFSISSKRTTFNKTVGELDKDRAMKALQQFLRPEFINRVDEIVCFNKLSEEDFRPIARLMLDELKASMKEKGLTLSYDDELVKYLVKKSYSAAPLRGQTTSLSLIILPLAQYAQRGSISFRNRFIAFPPSTQAYSAPTDGR